MARTALGAVRYANTRRLPPHQAQVKTSNVVFPQSTKPAGEGDRVLDGDVLARHHDALDEQAHQPLPAFEVERVEPLTHGCGKGLQLRFPLAQPLLIGMLRLKLLGSGARCLKSRLQLRTSPLQLVHPQRALLVGIHQALHLPLEVAAR
jgi:hypothetical protein